MRLLDLLAPASSSSASPMASGASGASGAPISAPAVASDAGGAVESALGYTEVQIRTVPEGAKLTLDGVPLEQSPFVGKFVRAKSE